MSATYAKTAKTKVISDLRSKSIADREDEEISALSATERWKLLVSDVYTAFKTRSMGFDLWLLLLTLLLVVVGLIMMYSASYAYAQYYHNGDSTFFIRKQLVYAIFGIAVMLGASLLPMWFVRRMVWPIYWLSAVLLVAVYFFPTKSEHRWINIGGASFQPSEIGKLAVILFIAWYATKNAHRIQSFKYGILMYVPVVGLLALLILFETHLSCFVVIMLITVSMIYIGGTPKKWLLILGGSLVGVILIMAFSVSYMRERIEVWRDPFKYLQKGGWQNVQALYAIASGGLLGQGLGNSRQKYLYIPEPQNDFVFAVICEELGFIGAVLIMLLFAAFVWRGLSVSISNPDRFARLLGVGITAQIGWQALLNIGVVTTFFPNTGISLPFFSYGGTSLLMLLASVGLLLAVSRGSANKTI